MQATTTTTRQQNIERRNTAIKEAFQKGYTAQTYPRRYTREYIISQIALDWCLSMGTVENILYTKPAEAAPEGPAFAQAA